MKSLFKPSAVLVASITIMTAQAADGIPKESGFSGFVNFGAGLTNVESNTVSDFSTVDFKNDKINGLDAPSGSETSAVPMLNNCSE